MFEFILFLLKTITIVSAVIIILFTISILFSRGRAKLRREIQVERLNDHYEQLEKKLKRMILSKKAYQKQCKKLGKKSHKLKERHALPKIFVIDFKGDLRATAVQDLREMVSMVLTTATNKDEVVVKLDSGGGMVNSYGLAASQLQRLIDAQIRLTVIIDQIAASGGYLMACVANKIIAAPFAIIGSIGVVTQLPNFHRFLKEHKIDFEQISAGKYKRTLSLFGENNKEGRLKVQEELELIHTSFKNFLKNHRPIVDLETVATGEYWLAEQAKNLNLVDEISTSDDYLLKANNHAEIILLSLDRKKSIIERLLQATIDTVQVLVLKGLHDAA